MTALPRWMKTAALAMALAMPLAATAQEPARTVAGVAYPAQAGVGGQTLQLNGAGIRYKAIFKVYTAGLYVGKKVSTTEEALAAPGPKRVAITMLRDIDANELGKLFTKGVEDNSPKSEMVNLIPGLLRMGQMFADQKQLKAGDTFHVDWVPGAGSQVVVKGVPQGDPIREPAFFNALLRIWLGPAPSDWKLKDALLGKS